VGEEGRQQAVAAQVGVPAFPHCSRANFGGIGEEENLMLLRESSKKGKKEAHQIRINKILKCSKSKLKMMCRIKGMAKHYK
jgi:hypothetical protein